MKNTRNIIVHAIAVSVLISIFMAGGFSASLFGGSSGSKVMFYVR